MRARSGILWIVALSFGCASPPRAPEDVPPDFAISITVMDRDGGQPVLARSLRPARYLVEPDLVLRASVGPGSTTTTYPPAMRTLTHEQVRLLWQDVEKAGYLGTDARSQVADTEMRPPTVVRPTALVYVCGAGRRRSLQIPLDAGDGAPTRAVIDRLADLAWVAR